LWVGCIELLEHLVDLSLPEPVKLLEALQELDNIILGALDGTSQKKDNLDNFFILGNPIIEWLSKLFWLVLLVPVLDILCGFENVTGSSVNGMLNLLKSWLECASVTLKMHIDLEEWLQDLFGHVSSSANSLLHLVERVFGGMKKSLIHGPVVVFGQLLDFFG